MNGLGLQKAAWAGQPFGIMAGVSGRGDWFFAPEWGHGAIRLLHYSIQGARLDHAGHWCRLQ